MTLPDNILDPLYIHFASSLRAEIETTNNVEVLVYTDTLTGERFELTGKASEYFEKGAQAFHKHMKAMPLKEETLD